MNTWSWHCWLCHYLSSNWSLIIYQYLLFSLYIFWFEPSNWFSSFLVLLRDTMFFIQFLFYSIKADKALFNSEPGLTKNRNPFVWGFLFGAWVERNSFFILMNHFTLTSSLFFFSFVGISVIFIYLYITLSCFIITFSRCQSLLDLKEYFKIYLLFLMFYLSVVLRIF